MPERHDATMLAMFIVWTAWGFLVIELPSRQSMDLLGATLIGVAMTTWWTRDG